MVLPYDGHVALVIPPPQEYMAVSVLGGKFPCLGRKITAILFRNPRNYSPLFVDSFPKRTSLNLLCFQEPAATDKNFVDPDGHMKETFLIEIFQM